MTNTAMQRVSQTLKEINLLLKSIYTTREHTGRDSQSNYYNESGVRKAITSDYLRVYNPIVRTHKVHNNFSFAFNNYNKSNGGGVVVGVKTNDSDERACFTFEEFKIKLKSFKKTLEVGNLSSDTVVALVREHFAVTNKNTLDLDPWFSELISNTAKTVEVFNTLMQEIKDLRENEKVVKKTLIREEFKDFKETNRLECERVAKLINQESEHFKSLVQINRDALIAAKPWITKRLVGYLLADKVFKCGLHNSLISILVAELNVQTAQLVYYLELEAD